MAKTFQFEDFHDRKNLKQNPAQENPNCLACEEMIPDAADGVLSAADQAFFDLHLTGCAACAERFAAARRGAQWLELLRSPRPEPSAALMERILSQTSNQTSNQTREAAPEAAPEHLLTPAYPAALPANVLPFIPRSAPVSRFTRFTRLAMEPRFAMTAAMAFFSIALTLNLTGVRFDQIKAADLKPSSLKRSFFEARASAVRYSDNLRVVRVLESRVDDLRQSNADSYSNDRITPSSSRPAPASEPKPEKKQPKQTPEGSSRRESPLPASPLLNVKFNSTPDRLRLPASSAALSTTKEGGLA